jgi:hypothetical protein
MDGLMVDYPLTLDAILRRADTLYRTREIVSRLPDKSIHRCTYAQLAARSRRLAAALRRLGIQGGDRVATFCTIRAIEEGYFQRAISQSAYEYAKRKESGKQAVVGVNKYIDPPEPSQIEIHRTDPRAETRQVNRLHHVRRTRDNTNVERLLDQLAGEAMDHSRNLMPTTIELVAARASMGEIVKRLRAVFGTYAEAPVF